MAHSNVDAEVPSLRGATRRGNPVFGAAGSGG
jgi:hypothetical protein